MSSRRRPADDHREDALPTTTARSTQILAMPRGGYGDRAAGPSHRRVALDNGVTFSSIAHESYPVIGGFSRQTALADQPGENRPYWARIVAAGSPDAYVRHVMVNSLRSWTRRRSWREPPTMYPSDAPAVGDAFADVDARVSLRAFLLSLPRNSGRR